MCCVKKSVDGIHCCPLKDGMIPMIHNTSKDLVEWRKDTSGTKVLLFHSRVTILSLNNCHGTYPTFRVHCWPSWLNCEKLLSQTVLTTSLIWCKVSCAGQSAITVVYVVTLHLPLVYIEMCLKHQNYIMKTAADFSLLSTGHSAWWETLNVSTDGKKLGLKFSFMSNCNYIHRCLAVAGDFFRGSTFMTVTDKLKESGGTAGGLGVHSSAVIFISYIWSTKFIHLK